MRPFIKHIKIAVAPNVYLTLHPIGENASIYEIDESEAQEFGEATIQILEGRRYEYELSDDDYHLEEIKKCVIPSKSKNSRGTIVTGNYVGTLELYVLKEGADKIPFNLEVLATKFNSSNDLDKSYRQNYHSMLKSITSKCTELLMQTNSPVNQNFEPDFNKDNQTIYQRFSFVKSLINSNEFEESILKIITSPKTNWINKEELADIRSIKRFSNKNVKDLLKGKNRIPLSTNHPLYTKYVLESVPSKIANYKQIPSLDNPENRFIKHALQSYVFFCEKCIVVFKANSTKETKDIKEAVFLRNKLEGFLSHSFFKEISRPTTLKLNSPTLQRKSGYRQILKSWLMYDLAAKLIWAGGEDVYGAGKRDIATLYEYWLFFILYDLFNDRFKFSQLEQEGKSYDHLIQKTDKGLNIIVKAGQHTALSGKILKDRRELNFKFSFNRTFSGNEDNYPNPGSWTVSMRPDYTLSVWPTGLKEYQKDNGERESEIQEQIVHIHFDAKYKVDYPLNSNKKDIKLSNEQNKIEEQEELNDIKKNEREGKFKNADLLKMHAYKDAIRRTGGAYVLYPGSKEAQLKGFHELIPGLGAFSMNPATEKENVDALGCFIDKVIEHLVNRASQRENIAAKSHKIYSNTTPNELRESIPEYINDEKLIPDETFVLVGYCKSEAHLNWINHKLLYNFRMNSNRGALKLTQETLNAKYLLLHMNGDKSSSRLFKIQKPEYRVTHKNTLQRLNYPNPRQESYLIVKLEQCDAKEFENVSWNFKELKKYKFGGDSGIPFTVSLPELMNAKQLAQI
tara:strand:+ start:3564 stop:5948 length:2385 start_codon:yes stop_codon:yes gene_type:complete